MDKQARQALIARLQAENAETIAEVAERKRQRALNGDFDPLPVLQPVVTRSSDDNSFDMQASLDDQAWYQQRSLSQPQASDDADRFVTLRNLEDVISDIGTEFARAEKTLIDRLEKLENEITLLRALSTGSIRVIEGTRHASKTA